MPDFACTATVFMLVNHIGVCFRLETHNHFITTNIDTHGLLHDVRDMYALIFEPMLRLLVE